MSTPTQPAGGAALVLARPDSTHSQSSSRSLALPRSLSTLVRVLATAHGFTPSPEQLDALRCTAIAMVAAAHFREPDRADSFEPVGFDSCPADWHVDHRTVAMRIETLMARSPDFPRRKLADPASPAARMAGALLESIADHAGHYFAVLRQKQHPVTTTVATAAATHRRSSCGESRWATDESIRLCVSSKLGCKLEHGVGDSQIADARTPRAKVSGELRMFCSRTRPTQP
jgi:hypothetical protein